MRHIARSTRYPAAAAVFALLVAARGPGTDPHQGAPASAAHPWCTRGHRDSIPNFTVSGDSLGPLTSRLTWTELRRVCPGLRDTIFEGAEGIPRAATVLRLAGRRVGLIEWRGQDKLFSRLLIVSPAVRTRDSLGVGTSVGELRRRLGTLRAGYDDAGVYVWTDAEPRLSYLLRLRASALLPSPDDIAQHPELIPDSARVRTVILVGN
jgi:hypothetical protein